MKYFIIFHWFSLFNSYVNNLVTIVFGRYSITYSNNVNHYSGRRENDGRVPGPSRGKERGFTRAPREHLGGAQGIVDHVVRYDWSMYSGGASVSHMHDLLPQGGVPAN